MGWELGATVSASHIAALSVDWFLIDHNRYKHAIKELPKQRDRGAAIVATAILEDHLLAAIKSRLHRKDRRKEAIRRSPSRLCGQN